MEENDVRWRNVGKSSGQSWYDTAIVLMAVLGGKADVSALRLQEGSHLAAEISYGIVALNIAGQNMNPHTATIRSDSLVRIPSAWAAWCIDADRKRVK